MKKCLILLGLLLLSGLFTMGTDSIDGDFEKILHKHLSALRAKDYQKFSETLATHKLTLVLPNGKMSKTSKEFLDMHREWFKETGWSMSHEIISTSFSGNLGFALTRSEYREKERDGEPYLNVMYVSRVFEKIDGKWLMVYDQATSIKEP